MGGGAQNMRLVGVVGSRERKDRDSIHNLIDSLDPEKDIVVSGGCWGPDKWAAERARERGIEVIEHLPKIRPEMTYSQRVQAYYDRNMLIAKDCDILYAFVSKSRKGGTENTIKYAKALNKKVILRY